MPRNIHSYEDDFNFKKYNTLLEIKKELNEERKDNTNYTVNNNIMVNNQNNPIAFKSYKDVQYYDLFDVFNYTLETISHNKLPSLVIKLSEEFENKMNLLYTNIEKKGEVKNYVEELTKILYDFVDDSHELVDAIYNNLKELNYILLTKDNPFTQITNYYLNNTSISYVKLVARAFKVFDNYFYWEKNRTYPKIEAFLKMFVDKSYKDLESEREYIFDIYTDY